MRTLTAISFNSARWGWGNYRFDPRRYYLNKQNLFQPIKTAPCHCLVIAYVETQPRLLILITFLYAFFNCGVDIF